MTDNTVAEQNDVEYDQDGGVDPGAGTLEILPPARLPDMAAINTLREHVGAMRDAKFFAEGMCYTALVPDRFRGKPGDGAAAILYGAEIGLSPVASLRSVIVIHGQPSLEARTMKALLKAKGYRFKTYESTDEACDIEAWSPDGSESERCRFTINDAIRAEFVPVEIKPGEYKKNSNGKLLGNMKYITEPRTMLRAKATAIVCREIAPHILLGMPYSTDELSTEDWSTDPSEPDRRRPTGSGVDGMRAARERREQQREQRATIVDAEVDESTELAAESRPEPETEQVNAAAGADETAPPPPAGSQLSEAARRKWLDRMFQLLNAGDCSDRDDQLIVIRGAAKAFAEAKKLPDPDLRLEHRDAISDDQLKSVVTQLNNWDKKKTLGKEITELLNQASLEQLNAEQQAEAEATPADESESAAE